MAHSSCHMQLVTTSSLTARRMEGGRKETKRITTPPTKITSKHTVNHITIIFCFVASIGEMDVDALIMVNWHLDQIFLVWSCKARTFACTRTHFNNADLRWLRPVDRITHFWRCKTFFSVEKWKGLVTHIRLSSFHPKQLSSGTSFFFRNFLARSTCLKGKHL